MIRFMMLSTMQWKRSEYRFHRGMTRKKQGNRGYSLVELVVAFSIVSIVVGLTLTGIQAARESARKVNCSNSLRQLTLATLEFESTQRWLPTATLRRFDKRQDRFTSASGYWRLFPYLDQQAYVDHIGDRRFHSPSFSIANQWPELRRKLPFLLCPSDGVSTGTNYRFCTGSIPSSGPWQDGSKNAPLAPFTQTTADIKGGLSNTAGFGERLIGLPDQAYDHRRHIWAANLLGDFDSEELDTPFFEDLVRSLGTRQPTAYVVNAGATWHRGGKHDTMYDHVFPPNQAGPAMTAAHHERSGVTFHGSVGTSANHRGGVNLSKLDGATRFVSDNIDLAIYRSLGSKDD